MTARSVPSMYALANEANTVGVEWMLDAACSGGDDRWFFMNAGKGNGYDAKRRYCASCPVIDTCLDYAIVMNLRLGVYGGMNERERRLETYRRKREGEFPFADEA